MIRFEKGDKALVFDNVCYTLNMLDMGTAANKITTTGGLNEIGVIATGNKVDSRKVVITGFVLAKTAAEMEQRKRYLFRMINPTETFDLIKDSKRITLQASNTAKASTDNYRNNDRLFMFSLECLAVNPCWQDINNHTENVAMWLPMFHFPLVVPKTDGIIMGLKEPKLIADITNNGDMPTGMIIEFSAKGTLTNPSLLDINTRQKIRLIKQLAAGDVISINTNYGNKQIVCDTENYFQYLDLDNSDFLQLNVGENQFKYDADTNSENLEVKIIYNQSYLGV